MIDDTLQQAYKDRQQLVTWAHESGMSAEDAERAYPQVGLVWTMLPFAREARIIRCA